jgi:transcriptional regulator with XRE-family HTH domain
MPESDATTIRKAIAERFRMAADASGLSKTEFADRLRLSSAILGNMAGKKARVTPPSHVAIYRAIQEFGFTADWFYQGSKVGFRDPKLARRLTEIEESGKPPEPAPTTKSSSAKKARGPRKPKPPNNP